MGVYMWEGYCTLLCVYMCYWQPLTVRSAAATAFNLTEATFSNRTCFSCSLDFRYVPWQGHHPCLGWTEPVSSDYLVQCGGHQPICQV